LDAVAISGRICSPDDTEVPLMATKHKNRAKRAAVSPSQHIQRWLEKGNAREALKEAKVWYRRQPGPEARQWFERASLARGWELQRAGLREESRAVVEALLKMGVTEPSVKEQLPKLLVALGLLEQAARLAGTSPESDPALLAAAADQCVLRAGQVAGAAAPLRQGAESVRRALAALEAGEEEQALAALREIPRQSPLADWVYLVRGLAAYCRQDAAAMAAAWDRLDPDRAAARIAGPLRVLADPAAAASDKVSPVAVNRLKAALLGGPLLAGLEKLHDQVSADRWPEAARMVRSELPLWRQHDPKLPERIIAALRQEAIRKDPAAVRQLAAVAPAEPLDPRWNRALALAWEHRLGAERDDSWDEDEDDAPPLHELEQVERHWLAYIEDLDRVECLSAEERGLARALVWQRLGEAFLDYTAPLCMACRVRHDPDERLQAKTVECLEKSIQLRPDLLAGYQALAGARDQWKQPDEASAVRRRLVERFPDHLETLVALVDDCLKKDEPFEARPFALRALRLKPLDPDIRRLVWSVHVAAARRHATAGRFEEGRAELAAAEAVGGQEERRHEILARRAVLEFKAGNLGPAHRLLEEAARQAGEPCSVLLLTAIEATRQGFPKMLVLDLERRWQTALKKKCASRAAGGMCSVMAGYVSPDVPYVGRTGHLESLFGYLERCSRVRWEAADLTGVLRFLTVCRSGESEHSPRKRPRHTDRVDRLLERLAARGVKLFPNDFFFHFMVGQSQMAKGPDGCDFRLARRSFERVVELCEAAEGESGACHLRWARKNLATLDMYEAMRSRSRWSFGSLLSFFRGGGDEEDEDDYDEDDFEGEEDDDFDDEEDDDFDGGPTDFGSIPWAKYLDRPALEVLDRACREVGLDLGDMLDRAAQAAGLPRVPRFQPPPNERKRR
jgi:hypothetical protein